MPNSIKGRGQFFTKTDTGILYPRAITNFVATQETESEDITGTPFFEVGDLETFGINTTSNTWTITVTQQYMVEADIPELFYNVYPKKSTGTIAIPEYQALVVSSGTITVTGAATDPMLSLTVIDGVNHIPLTEGDPSTSDFEYSVSVSTITVPTVYNGKTVAVTSTGTIPIGSDVIGGANGNEDIVSVEMHGAYKIGNSIRKVWFPKLESPGGLTVPIGSSDDLEKEYRATIPTELGWAKPYLDYPTV